MRMPLFREEIKKSNRQKTRAECDEELKAGRDVDIFSLDSEYRVRNDLFVRSRWHLVDESKWRSFPLAQ